MTIFRLILRNFAYFRGVNLAVIAGVAVATAVLSGALMVGDSVRQSLIDLAVTRLGKIDAAVITGRFFDTGLADRIRNDPAIKDRFDIAPAVMVRGGASVDSTAAHTSGVQIIGVGGDWAPVAPNHSILNSPAAEALGITATNTDIVLSVPTESDIPREATLAQRSRQDALAALRAKVSTIAAEPGMLAQFSSAGGQRTPLSAWVNLADLQNAVGQPNRINTLFAHDKSPTDDVAQVLNAALRRAMTLADYGLRIAPLSGGDEASLVSRTTYIDKPVEVLADGIATESGVAIRKISVNLINAVNRIGSDGRPAASIHYAVGAGITSLGGTALADDEIVLNQWAATQLAANVGDRISLAFYARQQDGSLVEVGSSDRGFSDHFRVSRILPMSGEGADASLSPTYKGLTDATSIAGWNPPAGVKIDKKLVTPADEEYWKAHKAAPKLFVSFNAARKMWGSNLGDTTSIRLPANRATEFSKALASAVDPAVMGMSFRALRQEQIVAAGGTTDFGQLFIGFSFFLIIAAAMLVAMLLRLGVEQRARQFGAMSAIGFAPRSLRKIMLLEGMLLAVLGGILGTVAAVAYTAAMMAGLRTWWLGAVGTTAMKLHVVPLTLVIGFLASQVVSLLAILWAVRQVGRTAPARLLAGGFEAAAPAISGRTWLLKTIGSIGILGGLSLIVGGIAGKVPEQVAFLAGGAILLASGLCLMREFLTPRRSGTAGISGVRSIVRLGMRNTTRHTARSVLCVALIALASFALVTVAAMRRGESDDTGDRRSGAGGYRLIVESQIPLLGNPATEQGRNLLGFREPTNPIWDRVKFLPMRRRAGEDVSCLNLMQAVNPTITAIPHSLIERGGFAFADVPDRQTNPWTLLERPLPSEDIPIIADDNTAKYVLHIATGDTLEIADHTGAPRKLRLVATLSGSIFQGTLLMSEENLRKISPADSGFGVVLVEVEPADLDQVRRLLSDELADYAAGVRTTASVMAGYLQVQNTYLSTFQLLGALGLMLGTIGLAVVLVRTVIERRSELALLASLGFRSGARLKLVLVENAFLLISGLLLGTTCAIIGVLPALRDSSQTINFTSLMLTLSLALVIGLAASGLAAVLSGSRGSPAELRKE